MFIFLFRFLLISPHNNVVTTIRTVSSMMTRKSTKVVSSTRQSWTRSRTRCHLKCASPFLVKRRTWMSRIRRPSSLLRTTLTPWKSPDIFGRRAVPSRWIAISRCDRESPRGVRRTSQDTDRPYPMGALQIWPMRLSTGTRLRTIRPSRRMARAWTTH